MGKLPSKVKIGYLSYDIDSVPAGKLKDVGDEKWLSGQCNNILALIRVENGNPPLFERETVLQEIIHAVDYQAGNTLTEGQVQMLGVGVLGVLRENPKLRAYLFDKE